MTRQPGSKRVRPNPPTADDVAEMRKWFTGAVNSGDEDRLKCLISGLFFYGSRFLDYIEIRRQENTERYDPLLRQCTELFAYWISGGQLSAEPGNTERRAFAAAQLWLDAGGASPVAEKLGIDIIRALLAPPVGNPFRNEQLAREVSAALRGRPGP